MKKLLIIAALILSSCAYDAKIDSRSTMVSCVDKGLDKSTLIECSSSYADERKQFCESEYKRQTSWLGRKVTKGWDTLWHGPKYLGKPNRHTDAIFIQQCLKDSGVDVFNEAF